MVIPRDSGPQLLHRLCLIAQQFEDGPEDPSSTFRLALIVAAHLLPA